MAQKWEKYQIIALPALIAAVYFFLKYITPLISPILLAMLFVTMFGPLLKKMQKRLRIHRQIGAVILLFVACSILTLLVWILFSWVVGSLPQWTGRLDIIEQQIMTVVQKVCDSAGRAIGVDSVYLKETLLKNIQEGFDYVQEEALPGVLSRSFSYARKIAAFIGFLVTFLIAAVLLAKDYDRIMNHLLDKEEYHVLLEVICGMIRYIATFVRAQLVIMAAISLLCAFVLTLTGIENGVLWGLLAGLLDVLPLIGTGAILIPVTIFQFVSGHIGQGVVCLILYACCAFLRELLEPKLIGKKIGVAPIAVLISVYTGVALFGLWGIIKGPLGFMMICQIWHSLQRRWGK